jgi:hypothetical protein
MHAKLFVELGVGVGSRLALISTQLNSSSRTFMRVAATRQPTGLELGNPFPLFGTVLILRVEEFFDARSEGFVDFLIRKDSKEYCIKL